jgi:hypothetical protein
MKRIIITFFLLVAITICNAQKDTLTYPINNEQTITKTKGGLAFYPLSKSIAYRSSMSKRIFLEAKLYFEITNALLYKFEPSINYRIINSETVKLYSGIGIAFQGSKSLTIPFGIEFFPIERIKTLSITLESGINTLLIPGYLHIGMGGDIGFTYYFIRTKRTVKQGK